MNAPDVTLPASRNIGIKRIDWLEYYLRYGWVRFKDLLAQNVSVDKNFFPADAARRLMSGELPKGVKITCIGRRDGVGMQTLARMSGLNFAKAFGACYVDAPFEWLGHCDRDMTDWVSAWENLFNLGEGERTMSAPGLTLVPYIDYFRGATTLTPNAVLCFQQCFWLGRKDPDSFTAIIPSLRRKYGLRPAPAANRPLVAAVHVRRGDITPGRPAGRYTKNGVIVRSMRDLQSVISDLGLTCEFHLHSEGEPKEFQCFAELGCALHLNADALWTMRQLIEADVLLMSKSSFSYVAALINAGVKLYEPCMNPGLTEWVFRRADGGFDQAACARKLLALTKVAA
jgi:hypothetical protein